MLVAIDIRNRAVTVGLRADGIDSGWLAVRKFGGIYGRTADEYAMLIRQMLFELGIPSPAPSYRLWISSVVPALTPLLAAAASEVFGAEVHLVGPGIRTGLKIRTDLPGELGSDLVCAAVAGRKLVKGAFIVVDFGVAITFSAVNGAGEFLGAAFAPGLEAQAESLRQQAAQLSEIRLDFPGRAIGRSTAESMRSGILFGAVGQVRQLIEAMSAEIAPGEEGPVAVIGSGDALGKDILHRLGHDCFVPGLVLEGIAMIAGKALSPAVSA
ncbi:MAG: type III pantothenate kinase [Spirochaetaceae bacterium]|nr:type III pantothenate kinase [Spirochaetaceae bacterium]